MQSTPPPLARHDPPSRRWKPWEQSKRPRTTEGKALAAATRYEIATHELRPNLYPYA